MPVPAALSRCKDGAPTQKGNAVVFCCALVPVIVSRAGSRTEQEGFLPLRPGSGDCGHAEGGDIDQEAVGSLTALCAGRRPGAASCPPLVVASGWQVRSAKPIRRPHAHPRARQNRCRSTVRPSSPSVRARHSGKLSSSSSMSNRAGSSRLGSIAQSGSKRLTIARTNNSHRLCVRFKVHPLLGRRCSLQHPSHLVIIHICAQPREPE